MYDFRLVSCLTTSQSVYFRFYKLRIFIRSEDIQGGPKK